MQHHLNRILALDDEWLEWLISHAHVPIFYWTSFNDYNICCSTLLKKIESGHTIGYIIRLIFSSDSRLWPKIQLSSPMRNIYYINIDINMSESTSDHNR